MKRKKIGESILQWLFVNYLRLLEKTETVLPQVHRQIHFALPPVTDSSRRSTVRCPKTLPVRSTRLFDGWCLRQPQDRVPFGSRSLVEETTV